MTMTLEDRRALQELDVRLRAMLPEEYQDAYEALQPVPMRSAGLKYRADGTVAWNEIWGSFCDLAMAGGPPHKGTLLTPGDAAAIDAAPERYDEVAEEICRGVRMAADLDAEPSPTPGWVRVLCLSPGMAGWLVRAITMENVAARMVGTGVDLPAAPHFRLEKEIKNVVTVIAKTSHYWMGHLPRPQQRAIAALFTQIAATQPLVQPDVGAETGDAVPDADARRAEKLAEAIAQETGLRASPRRSAGWLGLECPSVEAALWMMRALVVSNVLSRREESVLFVPVNGALDPDGTVVARAVSRIHRLAAAKGVL